MSHQEGLVTGKQSLTRNLMLILANILPNPYMASSLAYKFPYAVSKKKYRYNPRSHRYVETIQSGGFCSDNEVIPDQVSDTDGQVSHHSISSSSFEALSNKTPRHSFSIPHDSAASKGVTFSFSWLPCMRFIIEHAFVLQFTLPTKNIHNVFLFLASFNIGIDTSKDDDNAPSSSIVMVPIKKLSAN